MERVGELSCTDLGATDSNHVPCVNTTEKGVGEAPLTYLHAKSRTLLTLRCLHLGSHGRVPRCHAHW